MNNDAEMNAAVNNGASLVEGFGTVEMDAIGEIQNITMGSAATAVSNLLNAKVWITTPKVTVVKARDLSYPNLEPSIHVKIEYIKGISGSSILILKQNDVQLILNQLMGMPLVVTEDFKFDEMNISAVCEVMNQMMGASATALAELINTPIDISTPEATVNDGGEAQYYPLSTPDEIVVSVCFDLTIDGIIKSEFISILSIDLAKSMAEKMLAGYGDALDEATSTQQVQAEPAVVLPPPQTGGTLSQAEIEGLLSASVPAAPVPAPSIPAPQVQAPLPMQPPVQPPYGQPVYAQQPYPQPPVYDPAQAQPYGQVPPQYAQPSYPQQPYAAAPQYGYPQQVQKAGAVNIQAAQLHSFETFEAPYLPQEQSDNLQLLMGVPLNVTVEIGSAKRKVKEILEFTQGTIIELERQAGAPVDVIVNGHLIARGDVVVIEDNFAVRITEIIKSRFLDTLGNKE